MIPLPSEEKGIVNRNTGSMKKNFPLLIIPSFPFGRWVCGALVFTVPSFFFKLAATSAVTAVVHFAHVAIISTLALIACLAFPPILCFDFGTPLPRSLLGFFATEVPIIMLTIPIWPLHQHLLLAKRQALTGVALLINEVTGKSLTQSLGKQTVEDIGRLRPIKDNYHSSQLSHST